MKKLMTTTHLLVSQEVYHTGPSAATVGTILSISSQSSHSLSSASHTHTDRATDQPVKPRVWAAQDTAWNGDGGGRREGCGGGGGDERENGGRRGRWLQFRVVGRGGEGDPGHLGTSS